MISNPELRLKAFADALDLYPSHPIFQESIHKATIHNPWFTPESIESSIQGWKVALRDSSRTQWLQSVAHFPEITHERLGIIGAGNIPLVVMHDVICGVIAGYGIDLKLSSDDQFLPKAWLHLVSEILGQDLDVQFVEQLKTVQRVIATGSNNTHRYFEYYFKDKPHILRKNRHSVAVLPETLQEAQIIALGSDIFQYFGMGCRNVTQVWVPTGFDFAMVFPLWEQHFGEIINHHKYANNYQYHKALLLMNLDPHIDAGFVLFKERKTLHAPVGLVNYAFYDNIQEVHDFLSEHESDIQCVVSEGCGIDALAFGTAQKPELWDYADGVNTLSWLCNKS
jgi:hypothetical protein